MLEDTNAHTVVRGVLVDRLAAYELVLAVMDVVFAAGPGKEVDYTATAIGIEKFRSLVHGIPIRRHVSRVLEPCVEWVSHFQITPMPSQTLHGYSPVPVSTHSF